jgi:hypothetical protein
MCQQVKYSWDWFRFQVFVKIMHIFNLIWMKSLDPSNFCLSCLSCPPQTIKAFPDHGLPIWQMLTPCPPQTIKTHFPIMDYQYSTCQPPALLKPLMCIVQSWIINL